MTMFIHVSVVGVFLVWLVLTTLNQFESQSAMKLRRHDIFYLLPRWTFFAPNPGTSDYHLVYRYMKGDGTVSEFREVTFPERQPLLSALWNPHKRLRKAFLDLSMDLTRLCGRPDINEDNIKITFSYLAVLNFLKGVPLTRDVRSVQFAIMKSKGFIDSELPKLVICSDFHDI